MVCTSLLSAVAVEIANAITDPSPTICAVLPAGQTKYATCREGTRGTFVKVTVLGNNQRAIVCGVHVSGIPRKVVRQIYSLRSVMTKLCFASDSQAT